MARDSLERLGVAVPLAPVNPVELLCDLIDQSAAIVAYLRERVEALPSVLTDLGTHPLVRLYGQERDRAARVAREAVALGLEERRVRVSEATRDRVVQVILATFQDLSPFFVGIRGRRADGSPGRQLSIRESGAHILGGSPGPRPT